MPLVPWTDTRKERSPDSRCMPLIGRQIRPTVPKPSHWSQNPSSSPPRTRVKRPPERAAYGVQKKRVITFGVEGQNSAKQKLERRQLLDFSSQIWRHSQSETSGDFLDIEEQNVQLLSTENSTQRAAAIPSPVPAN